MKSDKETIEYLAEVILAMLVYLDDAEIKELLDKGLDPFLAVGGE